MNEETLSKRLAKLGFSPALRVATREWNGLVEDKSIVYRMRFDEASAKFAEFGPFYTGVVGPIDELLREVGVG